MDLPVPAQLARGATFVFPHAFCPDIALYWGAEERAGEGSWPTRVVCQSSTEC